MTKNDLLIMTSMAKHIELYIPNVGLLQTTHKAIEELLFGFNDFHKLSVHVSVTKRTYPKKREILIVTIENVYA